MIEHTPKVTQEAIDLTTEQASKFPPHEAAKCAGQLCPIHTPNEFAAAVQDGLEESADETALTMANVIAGARLRPNYAKRAVANLLQAASFALSTPIDEIVELAKVLRVDSEKQVEDLRSALATDGVDGWASAQGRHLLTLANEPFAFNMRMRQLERVYSTAVTFGMKEAAAALKREIEASVKVVKKLREVGPSNGDAVQ